MRRLALCVGALLLAEHASAQSEEHTTPVVPVVPVVPEVPQEPAAPKPLVYDPVEYSAFCPLNGCHPPESHFVCKFFDTKMERVCEKYPSLLEFEEEHVPLIENEMNRYRGLVAQGLAQGKGGEMLPRGYGIMRMKWDRQLAGLAKLAVETCPKEDVCVHTLKFPQVRSVRYNGVRKDKITVEGAVTAVEINNMLSMARTSAAHITSCPPEACGPGWNFGLAFYHTVQGDAKYFGCGSSFGYNPIPNNTRVEQTILNCHVSHYTKVGGRLYNTTPPQLETGFTNVCGCPLYHREVEDCLCEYFAPNTGSTPPMYDFPKYTNVTIRGPATTAETAALRRAGRAPRWSSAAGNRQQAEGTSPSPQPH